MYECLYCQACIEHYEELVPPVDDDAAWEYLANFHNGWCEWIATRAHRQEVAQ